MFDLTTDNDLFAFKLSYNTGVSIADPQDDYDNLGNLIKDQNKQITSISYNHLSLPVVIQFVGGKSISYLYNATGQKIRKTVVEPSRATIIIDYMNRGFQYYGGHLAFFSHAEGYVNVTEGRRGVLLFDYVYQYKDHLGNIRMDFAHSLEFTPVGPLPMIIMEESHYYPFGLKHKSYNTSLYAFLETEIGHGYYANITQMPPEAVSAYNYKYIWKGVTIRVCIIKIKPVI